MKFGFVITNLAGGGAERAVLNIAGGLARRGHEVHLVLLEQRAAYEVPANVSLHVLSRLSKGAVGKRFAAMRLRRVFRRLAGARPFDLVVSALPFANEVAILAELPRLWCRIDNTLSVEIVRLRADSPRKADRRLARYRRLYDGRGLIAVSQGVLDDLRQSLGLKESRIERIYNPFDLSVIRTRASEPANLPAGPYVIHVGRFVPQKRHDLLLDAWAQTPTPHRLVLLTHPDPDLTSMIAARRLSDRVLVAGFQTNPYAWVAGAELLILSSDHEGLPSVIIEALAVGTPVVSTDCPSGPRELLGGNFPECLVPVDDAAALAKTILRALAKRPDPAKADLSPYDFGTVLAGYERLAV